MRNLKQVIRDAKVGRSAVGHFNISDSTQFNAIIGTSSKLKLPVIVGVSEGEKKFIGLENAIALVKGAQARGVEVYLNLDHGHSVDDCKEAIDAGFDSVMFDGSKLSFEENVEHTKEVVEYAQGRSPAWCKATQDDQNASILVEGELGYIGSSSKMLDAVPEEVESAMTTAEQAVRFVEETGVDILAPSVGNLHGMLKGLQNPAIDTSRIKEIADSVPETMLVLHGGSGVTDQDFVKAIESGISIVHINTEIRRAYRAGIEQAFKDDSEQISPYKYLNKGRDAVSEIVERRLELFAIR